MISAKEFEGILKMTLEDAEQESEVCVDDEGEAVNMQSLKTFEEAGVLTGNAGLVLKLMDGSEFQITIV